MRIAVDCRMLGMSGIGTFLENILFELLSNNKSHSFLLIGNKAKLNEYCSFDNCEFSYNDIPIFSLRELLLFPVKEVNNCDVYFTPNYNIPLGLKIPIYSTIHDVVFLDVKGLVSFFGKLIRHMMLLMAVNRSLKIFTVSYFSKERIDYYFKTKDKTIVVPNGISFKLKRITNILPRECLCDYLLFVGNVKVYKGIKVLLQSYRMAKAKGLNKKLVIVGKYTNFKSKDTEVISLIEELAGEVIFTGYIDDDLLYSYIYHASLLIQPSFYEGYGLPPLESLYLGTPVLLSDIPVFRDIYLDFDVNYFAVGDSEDLTNSLLNFSYEKRVYSLKDRLLKSFSYNKSANIILDSIISKK